jgi:hypothetical protein
MSRSLAGACEDSDRFRIEATVGRQAESTMEPHTDGGHPKVANRQRIEGRPHKQRRGRR